MPQVIRCFPKGVYFGGGAGASKDFYSEVYEVSQYGSLAAELRTYACSGATFGVTGVIESTDDSSFKDWSSLTPSGVLTGEGSGAGFTITNPRNYIRAKLTVSGLATVCVGFEVNAREMA
jgi:hypothetical protein